MVNYIFNVFHIYYRINLNINYCDLVRKLKINKIVLISIFLFAVLTLGVVSANENLDNLEIDGTADFQVVDLADSTDDEVISQDTADELSDGEPKEVEFEFPNEIKAGELFDVNITMPEESYGFVYYYFDDLRDGEMESYVDDDYSNKFSLKINQMGKHTLNVRFVSETPGICGDKSATKTYDIVDYGIEIYLDDSEWNYGQSNTINVDIPSEKGEAIVDIDGKTYNFNLEEDSISIRCANFNAAKANVKVTYKGDGDKLKEKTFSKVFNLKPNVIFPDLVAFGTSPNVTVNYVDGEKIKFTVLDSDETSVIDEKTVMVSDSKAIYQIPSSLKFAETYYMKIMYGDLNIYYDYFIVNPRMNIPNSFYNKKEYVIPIEFPEDYKNMNLVVLLANNRIFDGKIDDDGKIDLHLSNMSLADYQYFEMTVLDSSNLTAFWFSKDVDVWDVDPSSINLNFTISDKYVVGEDIVSDTNVGDKVKGYLTVLVDGVEVDRIKVSDYLPISVKTNDLKIGAHNLTLKYLGDDYFEPATREFSFNLQQYIVNIPEFISYNAGETIGVIFSSDATGSLILYIDGKKVNQWTVEDEIDYSDLSNRRSISCVVDDLNLAIGPHDVRFVYKGNKPSFDITKKVELGYTISFYFDDYVYGNENIAEIMLPEGATGSFKITIDGKEFSKFKKEDNIIKANVSEFIGSHEIIVDYSGDSKYKYPISVNGTFDVSAKINVSSNFIPYKSTSPVSLVLPKNAKGNLVLEIDGNTYAKQPVTNGEAEIILKNFDIGTYNLKAYYDGSDYEVESIEDTINVAGKISISNEYLLFNDYAVFYLNLPKDVEGDLIVEYSNKEYREKLVDGFAEIIISNFNLGEQLVTARFNSADGSFDIVEDFILHIDPIFDVPDEYVVFSGNTITVYVPSGFEGTVNVDVDGNVAGSKVISAGKASVSLSQLTAGSHSVCIDIIGSGQFDTFSKSFDINVSKAASPKLIATGASVYCGDAYRAKLLGIDGLPLKGAKVTFKVGKNKAVTKTTNKLGIAALAMNYKPTKYTLLVKYAKQTLKPKVTVKKVLTLKSVNVKKSARKLILQATLKKGKVAIKSKVVTFKFNGKTIRAKTNKYGIAKVTISKAVLNKLRVGRNVVYQASYLKDIAKKVAKVKK